MTTPVGQRHLALQQDADAQLIRDLVAMRKRKGFSQVEVAARMRVSQNSVSGFENGHDPRLSTIRRYAAAIGASVRHCTTYWSDQ